MILARRLMMCLLKAGWGEWILNPAVTVNTNGIAHYTAYKTNQREYYDSYANLDLTEAIVRSLHDENMQQWQAVKDAANELTGVTDWVLDPANNRIIYQEIDEPLPPNDPTVQYYYVVTSGGVDYKSSDKSHLANQVCTLFSQYNSNLTGAVDSIIPQQLGGYYAKCTTKNGANAGILINQVSNPAYDPNVEQPEDKPKYLPLEVVAQKIISNASSSDQGISLMAEAYLDNVAQSIFSTGESKQFVKLSDLIDQFEENKVLRI